MRVDDEGGDEGVTREKKKRRKRKERRKEDEKKDRTLLGNNKNPTPRRLGSRRRRHGSDRLYRDTPPAAEPPWGAKVDGVVTIQAADPSWEAGRPHVDDADTDRIDRIAIHPSRRAALGYESGRRYHDSDR